MILRSLHKTVYEYLHPAHSSHNEVRLMPCTDDRQTCLEFRLSVTPLATIFRYDTPGGTVHHFGTNAPHDHLIIVAESTVETLVSNPFEGLNFLDSDMAAYASETFVNEHAEFVVGSRFSPVADRFKEYAAPIWSADVPAISNFIALIDKIYKDIKYVPGATDVGWGADDVLEHKAGVCQDLAHLAISCLRSNGIPARYVSGYLYSSHQDGLRGEQATHAWAEVLLPSGKWLGIDPTNNVIVGDHHICAHTGRDYLEVTPTKGVYIGGSGVTLTVSVDVTRMTYAPNERQFQSSESLDGFARQRHEQSQEPTRRAETTPQYIPLAPVATGMTEQQQQQ